MTIVYQLFLSFLQDPQLVDKQSVEEEKGDELIERQTPVVPDDHEAHKQRTLQAAQSYMVRRSSTLYCPSNALAPLWPFVHDSILTTKTRIFTRNMRRLSSP